jgi:hypothetical protein
MLNLRITIFLLWVMNAAGRELGRQSEVNPPAARLWGELCVVTESRTPDFGWKNESSGIAVSQWTS